MLLLNKVLPLLFLPFGIVSALVLLAAWRKSWWPALLALLVLYAASMPLLSSRLVGWLETRYPRLAFADVEPADAVVVLGGILGPRPLPGGQPNWLETVERFEAGVTLVQTGRAGRLVFTGARMPWDERDTTEGEELRRQALARGVPAGKILVSREVANTAAEARAVAELMKTQGWKRVIVVTTGWHMPRAMLLFRRAGVEAIPFPVDLRCERTRRLAAIEFVPSGDAWQLTETFLRECYGYAFYRIIR
jgi:uncharacterized SAM-binding protein YcdF (DUF218 family)